MHQLNHQTTNQKYKLDSPEPTVSNSSAQVKGSHLSKVLFATTPAIKHWVALSESGVGFQCRNTQHGSVEQYHYRRVVNAIVNPSTSGNQTGIACSLMKSSGESGANLSDYPPSPYESDIWEHYRSASAGNNLQLKASHPTLKRHRKVDKLYLCDTAQSHGDFTTASAGISARNETIGGTNDHYLHAGDMRSSMKPSHNLGNISSVSPHAITVINPDRHIMPTNRVHNVSLHAGIPPSNINLEPHKYKSLELYYPSSTHEYASHLVLGHPHYSESDTNWLCHSTSCCHQEHLHYDTLYSVVASSSDMKLSTLSTCTTHHHQGIHDQQLWQKKLTQISPNCQTKPREGIYSSAGLLSYFTTVGNECLPQSNKDSTLRDSSITVTVESLELRPQPQHQEHLGWTGHYKCPNNRSSMTNYQSSMLQTLGKVWKGNKICVIEHN